MSERKVKLSFQKGTPSFLAKLKEQTGYQEPELGDKFKDSNESLKSLNKEQKDEEYDVQNAQIIQPAKSEAPEEPLVKTTFKPSFKLLDKR